MIRARRKCRLALAGLICLALVTAAGGCGLGNDDSATAADMPTGFFGIGPQTGVFAEDAAKMRGGGIETVRLPVPWSSVQPSADGAYEWEVLDVPLASAANEGLDVLPFLYSTPGWLGEATTLPIDTRRQREAWTSFLEAAVKRYGPDGEFWAEHGPSSEAPVKRVPIRTWQIWNEPNFFYFADPASPSRYGRLVELSAPAIRGVDPGADVILGGLFGRPRQGPPQGMDATAFLEALYEIEGISESFDGVSLHPYSADTAEMADVTEQVREVVDAVGDEEKGLYLTEIGWGDGEGTSFELGPDGQARELESAYEYLIDNQAELDVRQVIWFSWKDLKDTCDFCDSVGLFTDAPVLEPKPAWESFVEVTGGTP